MELILIRHPPVIHGAGRCYGRSNLSIDESTIKAHIEALSHCINMPVFCSPAHRCLRLADSLKTDYAIWPELQELDFGSWEGRSWSEISREEIDAWAADIWHYRPGGGESAAMLQVRWKCAVQKWRSANIKAAVVITHAGIIRMALADAGLIPEEERWSATIEHARIYKIPLL